MKTNELDWEQKGRLDWSKRKDSEKRLLRAFWFEGKVEKFLIFLQAFILEKSVSVSFMLPQAD